MALDIIKQDDKDQNQGVQPSTPQAPIGPGTINTGAAPTSGGSGAPSAPGGANAGSSSSNSPQALPTASPAAPTGKGTNYTNIQRIVDANQNNQLGSTINSGINSAVNKYQTDLSGAQQSFNDTSNQNRNTYDASKVGSILDSAGGQPASPVASPQAVQPINSGVGASGTNPPVVSEPTIDPSNYSYIQKLLSGSYEGPTSLDSTGKVQNQAAQAAALGKLTGTTGGRTSLLQQFAGGQNYSSGKQKLDNLLLGQTGTNDLQKARAATSGIVAQQQQADSLAQQKADQYKQEASDTGKSALGEFQNRVGNIDSEVGNNLSQKTNDYNSLYGALGNANQLTSTQAKQLGLAPGQQLYGVSNLQQYLDSVNPYNKSNVINSDEYNKLAALQKLGGNYLDPATQATIGQYNPAQVGKGKLNFNLNNANAAIDAGRAAEVQEYQNLIGGVNQDTGQPMQSIGTLTPSGNINNDIVALQNDINQRTQQAANDPDSPYNAYQTQYPYIQTNQEALAKLQTIASKYGGVIGSTQTHGTEF